jgi:hypothetical protein
MRMHLGFFLTFGVVAACGGPQTTQGTSLPAQPFARQAGSGGLQAIVMIANNRPQTIHLGTWTAPPPGYAGCPWIETQPPPGAVRPGTAYGFPLIYRLDGCTANESQTFSIEYGTDVSSPQTICTWTVNYVGAAIGFAYGVKNSPKTNCSFGYDSSKGYEYFYYRQRGSPRIVAAYFHTDRGDGLQVRPDFRA